MTEIMLRFAMQGIAILALGETALADQNEKLADSVGALTQTAVEKSAAGDHAQAADLISKAGDLLVKDSAAPQLFGEAFATAEIAQAHGDALYDGKFGDPCPEYARARVAASQAQDMAPKDGEVEWREQVTDLLARIERRVTRSACAAVPLPKPDPTYVGHYYLSGVRETGSELLLREDGTFEWYISYGAVDQFARGSWESDGGAIIIIPNVVSKDKPLYVFREVEPWNEAAENELLRRAYDAADAAIAERCPFLGRVESVDVTLTAAPSKQGPIPLLATLRAEAANALQRAHSARRLVEQLARAELYNASRNDRTETPRLTSTDALRAWETAKWGAIDAARKAGLPAPVLRSPTLPAACTLTKRKSAESIPPEQWTGGVGVRIYDIASRQGARDVKVTLNFADGLRSELVTERRGFALRPGRLASPVVGVDLAAGYAPGRDQALRIAPTSSGIIHVTIDAEQIIPAPFTTLRLRIDGRVLVFDETRDGRYERQP